MVPTRLDSAGIADKLLGNSRNNRQLPSKAWLTRKAENPDGNTCMALFVTAEADATAFVALLDLDASKLDRTAYDRTGSTVSRKAPWSAALFIT